MVDRDDELSVPAHAEPVNVRGCLSCPNQHRVSRRAVDSKVLGDQPDALIAQPPVESLGRQAGQNMPLSLPLFPALFLPAAVPSRSPTVAADDDAGRSCGGHLGAFLGPASWASLDFSAGPQQRYPLERATRGTLPRNTTKPGTRSKPLIQAGRCSQAK